MNTITSSEYATRVLARASNKFHPELVSVDELGAVIKDHYGTTNTFDLMKKAYFYGKPIEEFEGRTFDTAFMLSSLANIPNGIEIFHAVLGIVTEAGELLDALCYGLVGEFDAFNMQEELGDIEWYRTLALNALGQSHEENITQNDTKLEARFGAVFSEDAANNRDLGAERLTLEQSHANSNPE